MNQHHSVVRPVIVEPFSIVLGEVICDDDCQSTNGTNFDGSTYVYCPLNQQAESEMNARLESHILNTSIRASTVDGRNIVRTESNDIAKSKTSSRYTSEETKRRIIIGGKTDTCDDLTIRSTGSTSHGIKCDPSQSSGGELVPGVSYTHGDKLQEYTSVYGEQGYQCAEYKSVYEK